MWAKIGPSDFFDIVTFLRAILLGTSRARFIAEFISLSLYPLSINCIFSSASLLSLFSFVLQILTILRLKLYGMAFMVEVG